MLEPVKHTRLREQAAEQIRTLIMEGQMRPGDRLPSERELGVKLAVSRASVREALRSLEITGLLEVRPGAGAFVQEMPVEPVLDPLSSKLISRKGLLELLEVRQILEPQIAALAAQRAQPADIEELQHILDDVARLLERNRYDDAVRSIISFHRVVTRATGNRLLQRLMNAISGLLAESMRETLRIPGRPARSAEGHRQILAAITAHDAAAAESAMARHIKGVEIAIIQGT
jgi:GntR family transcriptional regulator, transcriptional repressor for pyruvate dehydrogenase complex